MGFAIAEAARELGASVTLITGPTSLTVPAGVQTVAIETTDEMLQAVHEHFPSCDCLVMAAAPADYRLETPAAEKMKKTARGLSLKLVPAPDILKSLKKIRRPKQRVVGFALETSDGLANARKKLTAKKLDLIVLNSPRDEGAAFEKDTNRVTIIRPGQPSEEWPLMNKSEVAVKLLECIASIM